VHTNYDFSSGRHKSRLGLGVFFIAVTYVAGTTNVPNMLLRQLAIYQK
jgi:hypothetical protein